MSVDKSFWYSLGYTLERARSSAPHGSGRKASGSGKKASGSGTLLAKARNGRDGHRLEWPHADDLFSSAAVIVAAKALDAWRPGRKVGLFHLARAALAGAGAALLLDLVRPLLSGDRELPVLDRGTVDRMLAGAGEGLLYGAILEPRVPGPALLKGALFGSAEYAADPAGGLTKLLGSHAPQSRVPFLRDFLEGLAPEERAYLEHVVFGVALALLCGPSSENGADPGD